MLYNIVLNNINSSDEAGLDLLKQLACENADLIISKTFPVIICRYATKKDAQFYKELAEMYGWVLSFKEVEPQDDVLTVFNEELIQKEQMDTHLLSKIEILESLEKGLAIYEEKLDMEDSIRESKSASTELIKDYYYNKTLKFQPTLIFSMFVVWIMISALLCMSALYTWETKIVIISCIFCVIMPATLIFEYIEYRKRKKHYNSNEYLHSIVQSLSEIYQTRNNAIHRVGNLIDSLAVRNSLTLLPFDKRDPSSVKNYITELQTDKSIEEIFALH